MADDPLDPNPALRAELEAALAILNVQIRGLHDLAAVSISPELLAEINEQIIARERRRDLIQAVLNALDGVVVARRALSADGYPALPDIELSTDLFQELQGQDSDLKAAIGIFEAPPVASRISAELGSPADKPPRGAR
jgi:hypothetical protein